MMMKKIMFAVSALAVSVAFAGVKQIAYYANQEGVTYYQFTHNEVNPEEVSANGDYKDFVRDDQKWLGAQYITLTIPRDMHVWLSNNIDSWFDPKPYTDLDKEYDMDAGYGYLKLNDAGNSSRIASNKIESTVTYFDNDNPAYQNSTAAYYLGQFTAGQQIGIWLTTLPEAGNEQVDTLQYVNDDAHDTTLLSRADGTHDLAGNVEINFGFDYYSTHNIDSLWVAVGVEGGTHPVGAPLPGVWATLALVGGLMGAKKMKKSKK